DWVSSELMFASPFVIVAARDNARIAQTGVAPGAALPLDLFCALPQAIRSIDGSMGGLIDEALAQQGRRREVVLAVPHFQGVALAVAGSGLIAALPAQFARAMAEPLGLATYQPPFPSPAPEIRMYWHRRHDRNPAHRWLREQVQAVVADL